MKRILTFTLMAFSIAATAWGGYDAIQVENGGWITGKISYAGGPPVAKKIEPTTDKAACGKHGPIFSEELTVSPDSGLQNAVVSIANITAGRSVFSMAPPVLEQNGCTFRPHVLVVPVGKPLTVRNSDGLLHNIHTHSLKNPPVNIAQAAAVPEITLGPYTVPELVKVGCDIHGWMSAWFWVTNNPYAVVTGANGSYKIADLPPGKYVVEVWHETLGKISSEVTVAAGKETRLNLTFPAARPQVQAKKSD